MYDCHADAEKCIFVQTVLSHTPQPTPKVTYDAGQISAWYFFLLSLKERKLLRKRDNQGRLSFNFFERLRAYLVTQRQTKIQPMSWKIMQMLFTWSWINGTDYSNCAHPIEMSKHIIFCVYFSHIYAYLSLLSVNVYVDLSLSNGAKGLYFWVCVCFSASLLGVSKQPKLWRVFSFVLACIRLRCSTMWLV